MRQHQETSHPVEPKRRFPVNALAFTLIVFSVATGTVIYLLWRPVDIVAFDWADYLGLSGAIIAVRDAIGPPPVSLPHWVLYSTPNALWTFAFVAAVGLVWRGSRSRERAIWLSVPVLIAIGSEVGQAAGLVPGTYTWADLIGTVAAVGAGLLVAQQLGGREGAET